VELLKALFHVYRALEEAIAALPAELRHCDFSALLRAESLETDLRYFLQIPEGQPLEIGLPSPAAKQYVDRLQRLSKNEPLLILAHAYTRYLGDLSGGQILSKAATKSYDLPAGQGVAFYNFERVGTSAADAKTFKRGYRASLDELRLDTTRADALVEEANAAFLLNMLLFEERDVAAGHLARTRTLDEAMELVRSNKSALGFQRAYAAGPAKCPFLPDPAAPARQGCPWPFVWLHDPRQAVALHPCKNAGGVLALMALGVSAWRFPRRTGAGVLGAILMAVIMKPRKSKRGQH
jgi:heme oxygenase